MDLSNLETQLAELERRYQERPQPLDLFKNITALLDQLCPAYLTASTQQQEQIRNAFNRKRFVLETLLSHIRSAADQLRASKNQDALLDGLTAASIESGRNDYRDVLLALSELYVAAEEVGIDPKPHFQAIARLSSNVPSLPNGYSTQRMLAEFHTFAVLRERKGEVTQEERAAMEEMVKRAFDEQFKQIEQSTPPAPWWKRIFGSQ